MKEFDPDQPFTKIRGMGTVHYEQNGCKFSSGKKFVGEIKGAKNGSSKPQVVTPDDKAKEKEGVRERARAKIAAKMGGSAPGNSGDISDFTEPMPAGPAASAAKENQAARQAEENA